MLVEGDDPNEPICDAVRGLLDGHTWLSRKLAARGHYPAIDVLESISRLMTDIVTPEHRSAAQALREVLAAQRDNEDLISIGAYRRGSNRSVDLALEMQAEINGFLRQRIDERSTVEQAAGAFAAIAKADASQSRPARPNEPAERQTDRPRRRQDAARQSHDSVSVSIGERAQAARGNSRRAACAAGRSPTPPKTNSAPDGEVIEADLAGLNQLRHERTATGPVNIDLFVSASRYEAVLRAELATIAGHEATLAAEIERRRQALMAADHEVRMLEKLRDKQRELHRQGEALPEMKATR